MEAEVIEKFTEVHKLKYTPEDISKLYKVGILQEDDRIELIEGEMFYMSPINFPHAQCVNERISLISN